MKVEQSFMVIERYVSRCWREQPESGNCSLTYTEYDYLETLEESGTMRLSELAELMHVSKPTASNMVARLKRKKLVKRQPCPEDGRAIQVALSQKGQELLDNDRLFYDKLIANLLNDFTAKDKKQLEQLLTKVAVKAAQTKADKR
ncbi:MarR family winged helix-turn-helix transcriptional regulator [Endozoicomonas montiporae]|uniref:MarR family transcriptional regulator n=1 Tax=Endozoicomonas montiporae CL-33 TaxID=570277 RepID=A0A142B6Z0_9GAMM|nr:MarR family transcriptional regulator [Endozoicomonas montiporae]AMO54516.1 MarR family transcriptional regulator [Endozoicomonas montiporae CL-33]